MRENRLYAQTVTLYHGDAAAQRVVRTVLRGVFWQHGRRSTPDAGGTQVGAAMLLVVPETTARYGTDYTLGPGDPPVPRRRPRAGLGRLARLCARRAGRCGGGAVCAAHDAGGRAPPCRGRRLVDGRRHRRAQPDELSARALQRGQQSRTAVPDGPVSPWIPFRQNFYPKTAHSSRAPRTQFWAKFPWRCPRRRRMSAGGDKFDRGATAAPGKNEKGEKP